MKYCNNFEYDLKLGQIKEKELGYIFDNKTIEVKTDLKASETGRVFVEYESRGKPSGISTSKADYYCFVISDFSYIIIKSKELKDKCRQLLNTELDVKGGDNNTSKGILLPVLQLCINI
tara:strand:- start:20 stop:376 length:357 start_codon:yes stop_codon:yes gene_type:complete